MKPENLNKFIDQMKIELAEAESKHPHFGDLLFNFLCSLRSVDKLGIIT